MIEELDRRKETIKQIRDAARHVFKNADKLDAAVITYMDEDGFIGFGIGSRPACVGLCEFAKLELLENVIISE